MDRDVENYKSSSKYDSQNKYVPMGELEDNVNFSECRTKTAMVDVNIHAYIPIDSLCTYMKWRENLQEKFSERKDMHFQTEKIQRMPIK